MSTTNILHRRVPLAWLASVACGALLLDTYTLTAGAAEQETTTATVRKPQFLENDALPLPEGYREWVFLGAPLTPNALNNGEAAFPEYHNTYIEPSAYAVYKQTGEFPEGTVIVKELVKLGKADHEDGSSNQVSGRGYFPGSFNGMDVSVKDSKRFAATNGWGYYHFGHHAPPYESKAAVLPKEKCAACHQQNAGADMVFDQFYPILHAR